MESRAHLMLENWISKRKKDEIRMEDKVKPTYLTKFKADTSKLEFILREFNREKKTSETIMKEISNLTLAYSDLHKQTQLLFYIIQSYGINPNVYAGISYYDYQSQEEKSLCIDHVLEAISHIKKGFYSDSTHPLIDYMHSIQMRSLNQYEDHIKQKTQN